MSTIEIDILKNIMEEDETIFEFHTTNNYSKYYCIATQGCTDIGNALEDTLHRLLDNDIDPYFIMGTYRPTPLEWAELYEDEDYIYVDLDYVISGQILSWKEVE